jgi:phage/plasmid-like protein (TIGR03299 family)
MFFDIDSLLDSALNSASNEEIKTLLDRYKLNWKVEAMPLTLPSGTSTPFYGLTRVDTEETFGTCKKGYQVFQNEQLAELVLRIGEKTGYEIHNGGRLQHGAHVYLQLKTGEIENIGENKDRVVGYATALNAHNGKLSVGWGHSNITISCQNTFYAAFKQLKNKARHTESMQKVIDEAMRDIDGVKETEKTIFETMYRMATAPVQEKTFAEVVKSVVGVDITQTTEERRKNNSTFALNRMTELLTCISREQKQKGATHWGLFSGVTKYTSHVLTVPDRENARIEAKIVGSAKTIDNRAYELLAL